MINQFLTFYKTIDLQLRMLTIKQIEFPQPKNK